MPHTVPNPSNRMSLRVGRLTRNVAVILAAGALSACGGWLYIPPEEAPPAPEAAAPAPAAPAPVAAQPVVTQPAPPASPIRLRANHPDRHVVVRGDTLWDLAGLFLEDPWLWPEIWYVNPQIDNPHLIYPGDVLRLVYVDGRPQLRMERAGGGRERLSPGIRVEPLDQAIKTIPYDAIAAFVSKPTVLDRKTIEEAPYVVAMRESHLIAGAGLGVYVRGTDAVEGTRFNVFHIGDKYRDPDTGEVLGYEALYAGQGRITAEGDPASLMLTETRREVLTGDRLLLEETDLPLNFYPKAPEGDFEGRIISVVDGISLIGQYQMVVINRGARHGVEPGTVLSIWQDGEVIRDRYANRSLIGNALSFGRGERVKLPEEVAGRLMIFRTRDAISYGLVMSATSEIEARDVVRNPR